MMPAQGSTISDTTHFTGGQVRSPTCLTCPAHLMADLSPHCFCHAPKASMVSCVDPRPCRRSASFVQPGLQNFLQ